MRTRRVTRLRPSRCLPAGCGRCFLRTTEHGAQSLDAQAAQALQKRPIARFREVPNRSATRTLYRIGLQAAGQFRLHDDQALASGRQPSLRRDSISDNKSACPLEPSRAF